MQVTWQACDKMTKKERTKVTWLWFPVSRLQSIVIVTFIAIIFTCRLNVNFIRQLCHHNKQAVFYTILAYLHGYR